jgi:hypothetical protein
MRGMQGWPLRSRIAERLESMSRELLQRERGTWQECIQDFELVVEEPLWTWHDGRLRSLIAWDAR